MNTSSIRDDKAAILSIKNTMYLIKMFQTANKLILHPNSYM